MECEPAVNEEVVRVAVEPLIVPVPIEEPASGSKITVPSCRLFEMVAVKVTDCWYADGDRWTPTPLTSVQTDSRVLRFVWIESAVSCPLKTLQTDSTKRNAGLHAVGPGAVVIRPFGTDSACGPLFNRIPAGDVSNPGKWYSPRAQGGR